jgi:hypothetical protein
MTMKAFLIILAMFALTALNSCGIYSFTGASLSPEIKTFTVKTFTNNASLVVPSLSENITEKLKDKFLREMNLKLVESDGDINFYGTVTDYRTAPSGISSTETAATSRLTITMKVRYENTKEPKNNFDATFSNYADFNSTVDFSAVEDELIEQIVEKLVQDIFNRSVNNW